MDYFTTDKITELPHLLEERYSKHIAEAQTKEQYERKFLVLNTEVNSFIEALPASYKEHALCNTNTEQRGGFSIVTATYGDAGLTDDALSMEDGEIQWWTMSSGKYTFHVKKLVLNNPQAIKAFCEQCKTAYGYSAEETSVTLSPTYGERYVYAEATFTESDSQGGSGGGSGSDDFNDDEADENGQIDEVEGISLSSSRDTISPSERLWLWKNLGAGMDDLKKIAEEEDKGAIIFRKQGDLNGIVKNDGWYDATNDNIKDIETENALRCHSSETHSPERVAKARELSQSIPAYSVTNLTATFSGKISSRAPLSIADITSKLTNIGKTSDTISVSGYSMPIPENLKKLEVGGMVYNLDVKWIDMGANFDLTNVKKKYCHKNMPYYVGHYTHSFTTQIRFDENDVTNT